MRFAHPFRTYQSLILDRIGHRLDAPEAREVFHIVSPPGSGKTILGLEMIHRLGERAVIFAPTTTIQRQWADKARMFCADDAEHAELVTTTPDASASISALTYQIISTVDTASDSLRDAARAQWEFELSAHDGAPVGAVRERLDTMRANNPSAYAKEIRRRIGIVRRRALTEPDSDIGALLHPNARALVDALVNSGVRTVVLDECHHLLDYWAIVLAYLISRIDTPRIIGLTATLPSLEDGTEYENYHGLLGDVTYEVPTPAVVKEGDLAPYRDLVAFVDPTDDEAEFLETARSQFADVVTDIGSLPSFRSWLVEGRMAKGPDAPSRWNSLLREDTPLAVSALRHAHQAGLPASLPAGLPIPYSARQEPTFEDSLAVLERYALDYLKISADRSDHKRLTELKQSLAPFGLGLTEAGLRQRRPIAESVMSYSLAKTRQAAAILDAEASALGDRFRAVVVTDFEKTGSMFAGDAKGPQRGSARRVFTELTQDPRSHDLDPVLVTGTTLWMDADHGQPLIDWFNTWLEGQVLEARCRTVRHPLATALEVQADGRGWSSGTYVRMVTAAFEQGVIKVLVGTRGLFAEGWDALSLAVMIDLTTAATSTSTQQLRGRAIRLDPTWPDKVAHNWDVVCLPPTKNPPQSSFADVRRLARRHRSVWGITPDYGVAPEHVGRITRGLVHVDPRLDNALARLSPNDGMARVLTNAHRARQAIRDITAASFAQIARRPESRTMWRIGDPYDNDASVATTLTRPSLPMRSVHSVSATLRKLLAEFRGSLVGMAALIATAVFSPQLLRVQDARIVTAVIAAGVVGWTAYAVVRGVKIYRTLMRGDHPDLVLKDIGRTITLALIELRLVSVQTQPEDVMVVETPSLSFEVRLARASFDDATLFARCMAEALAPIDRQRYVIGRDVSKLPAVWLRPAWTVLRRIAGADAGVTFHALPEVFGARKERAVVYAHHWNRNVGAGELIYTKTPAGFEALLDIRQRQAPESAATVYDIWR